jgi:hypothetical protein
MGVASQQDIPNRPEVSEPWTIKRLFPFSGTVTTIAKVFVNPLDVFLAYLVFVLGIAELLGREVSLFMWLLTILILAADIFERQTGKLTDSKSNIKKVTNDS